WPSSSTPRSAPFPAAPPAGCTDQQGPRMRPVTSALVLSALLLTACGTEAETAGDTGAARSGGRALTIGLTYTPDVQFAPFYVAEQRGYFDDAGVEVRLRHHGAAEGLFTAALAGEENVVVAGGDEMLQAVAEGAGLV